MREPPLPPLWLGNAADAGDPRLVHELGISAIVDLALEERPSPPARDVVYCRFPLVDGAGNAESVTGARPRWPAFYFAGKSLT